MPGDRDTDAELGVDNIFLLGVAVCTCTPLVLRRFALPVGVQDGSFSIKYDDVRNEIAEV